ncbi:MAG TPA: class I SAM-dependent methyltransferase [Burkholderiales bacterium]|nr:class I SAM-dependent methyltransferase [Burkholderiales bacterium]
MKIATHWSRMIPLALALVAPGAGAQEGRGDVVYVPTPQVVVDEMLRLAKVASGDFIIDLGSGDGRIIITAAKKFGARGFGVDLDRYLLKLANANAAKEGVTDRARFIEQNLFETDLSNATVITSYLLPEMNRRLRPKLLGLKPGTRVVAHDYAMGQWEPEEQRTLNVPEKVVGDPGKSYVYLWIVPAHVAGTWVSQLPIGSQLVSYTFNFDQEFQVVEGQVRVGERDVKLPPFRLNGEQLSFNFTTNVGNSTVAHRFRGSVKGDTIEGNVTIGGSAVGQRVMPWSARQTVRGEMRMGNDGVAMAGIQ